MDLGTFRFNLRYVLPSLQGRDELDRWATETLGARRELATIYPETAQLVDQAIEAFYFAADSKTPGAEDAACDAARRVAAALARLEIDHPAGSPKTATQRRGRPPASDATEVHESGLAERWDQARQCGVFKADFALREGFLPKDLDLLLARVRARKRRANK